MSYHELRAAEELAEISEESKQSMQLIIRTCEATRTAAELRYMAEEFEAAAWHKLQEERGYGS